MATLAVYRGDLFQRRVELGEGTIRIGRARENGLVLDDPDKGVSRTHAEIRYERGRYVIVDLNSQNGVWVGNRRIKFDLLTVDVPVTIGPYRLVLESEQHRGQAEESSEARPVSGEVEEASTESTERSESAVPVRRTQTVITPAPRPRRRLLAAALAAAVVVVVTAGFLVARVVFRSMAPSDVVSPPAPPPSPPVPSAEEQFQVHYERAQEYIEKGDTRAAIKENEEALRWLPFDLRGLNQRNEIEAIVPEPFPPAPAPAPPAPPMPETLRVVRKPDESTVERNARERTARSQLDDGKRALENHRYAEAIDLLQRALNASGRPDYGYTANEASSLLQSARAARESQTRREAEQKRATALRLVEESRVLAGSDIPGATRKVNDAMDLDPQVPGGLDLLKYLQEQAQLQGERALTAAKNFDRFKRIEQAIREYDRAVQLLELVPGGHKDLEYAIQRSTELKKPR